MNNINNLTFTELTREEKNDYIRDLFAQLLSQCNTPSEFIAQKLGVTRKTVDNWKKGRVFISEENSDSLLIYLEEKGLDTKEIRHCIEIIEDIEEKKKIYQLEKWRQPYVPEGTTIILGRNWDKEEVAWENVDDIHSSLYDLKDRIPAELFSKIFGFEYYSMLVPDKYLDILQMECVDEGKHNLAEIYAKQANISISSAIQVVLGYNEWFKENKRLGFGKEYWITQFREWNNPQVGEPSAHRHIYNVGQIVQKMFDSYIEHNIKGKHVGVDDNRPYIHNTFNLKEFITRNYEKFEKRKNQKAYIKLGDITRFYYVEGSYYRREKSEELDMSGLNIHTNCVGCSDAHVIQTLFNCVTKKYNEELQEFADNNWCYERKENSKESIATPLIIELVDGEETRTIVGKCEEPKVEKTGIDNNLDECFETSNRSFLVKVKAKFAPKYEEFEYLPEIEKEEIYAIPTEIFYELCKWYKDLYQGRYSV